jgi:hypothetical protein
MSWSFEIIGGDLNLVSDGDGASVVTGKDKTFQDLRHSILEPIGSDPMHPQHGSLLDGGRLPNGRVADSFIGQSTISIMAVKQEIGRNIQNYIDAQKKRIDSDIQTFGRTTLQDSEIVEAVISMSDRMYGNKLIVQVQLLMKSAGTITITQPVG